MRLACYSWNNCLTWAKNEVACLVVENPTLFRECIEDIMAQVKGEEGNLVFSEENTTIDFSKSGLFIVDIMNLESTVKKLENVILTSLCTTAKTEYFVELQQVEAAHRDFVEKLAKTISYPLEFAEQYDTTSLLKIASPHLVTEGGLAERVLNYTLAMQEFLHTKLVVFVGLKAYLTPQELLFLYKDWAYKQMNILLIEPLQRKLLKGEKTLIIDNDLCELLLVDNK